MTNQTVIASSSYQSIKDVASIKIRRLKIENYKGIDELDISFPQPNFNDEPDIMVIGSRNGVGKTSILESCALLLWMIIKSPVSISNSLAREMRRNTPLSINIPDLMVRAGAESASIFGEFQVHDTLYKVNFEINRNGTINPHNGFSDVKSALEEVNYSLSGDYSTPDFLSSLIGFSTEPIVSSPVLYFHSHRKIREGSPELGMMSDKKEQDSLRRVSRFYPEFTLSTFKSEVLRSLMAKANLFENLNHSDSENTLNKLNNLMSDFAQGKIEQLRFLGDNTIEFRVSPVNGGESFPFDGLSSGQKEMISTLFLIWKYTVDQPSIVLIDEPELHLNAEWHRQFINNLHKLAPHNQYIIATHSQYIVESVDADRRILLTSSD